MCMVFVRSKKFAIWFHDTTMLFIFTFFKSLVYRAMYAMAQEPDIMLQFGTTETKRLYSFWLWEKLCLCACYESCENRIPCAFAICLLTADFMHAHWYATLKNKDADARVLYCRLTAKEHFSTRTTLGGQKYACVCTYKYSTATLNWNLDYFCAIALTLLFLRMYVRRSFTAVLAMMPVICRGKNAS